MFDPQDRSWIARSTVTANAYADVEFYLSAEFYPDPNDLDDTKVIALPLPVGAGVEQGGLSSKDILDNPRELVDHYKSVLSLAREHGHSYNQFDHHMSLGLWFGWPDGAISFWYNTLDVMEPLFDWLKNAADGEMWSDVEQGWEMIAIRSGSRIHFRQGGFDQGGEYANVALPRDDLLASIADLRQRMSVIIARLTAEVGEDYWTRHRYDLRTDLT
jgi:hypothetical protein